MASMVTASRARVAAAQSLRSTAELLAAVAQLPPAPPLVLHRDGFDLIAEMKLRSPAAGQLQPIGAENLGDRAVTYATAGAAAVSVLTEPSRFDGSLTDLEAAARALRAHRVPAMRKDFLVDPYQVLEARLAGAGGVLVILRMLARTELERLVDAAIEHGLFVLLEAFDAADLDLAHALIEARLQARSLLLVGMNSRDLVTLQVVPERLERLVDRMPRVVPRVAESGVATAADAGRMARAGYQLALVGSALMSAADPRALAADMLLAGRRAAGAAVLRGAP